MKPVVSPSYKIGVDGGGSKTELILVDANGLQQAHRLAPGCNPSQVGAARAQTILAEALTALTAGLAAGSVQHTLLCMAGSNAFWQETATGLKEFGKVVACDDSVPVLELATDGAPGLVLHAGTGSFVAARDLDHTVHYVGGLGWKFGDPGSGFDIGRRALALALLELQRLARDPATPRSSLGEALRAHTGLADYAANSRFFYNDAAANAKIADFAPVVLALAAEDCGAAQQVVADSVADLARLADQVIHRLFPRSKMRLPCGVSGRILNSDPGAFALRSVVGQLNWPVELGFITTSPIEGVRRLLLRTP